MHSCIYEGHVRHRRFEPITHAFSYKLFLVYLDLDELDSVFEGVPFWSSKGFSLAQFRRSDHYGPESADLAASISSLVESKTGTPPRGPIRLLTHLRYFGYCFNPVSFYFCFDPTGSHVETIVAEVDNTPWGERHCYVLDSSMNEGSPGKKRFRFSKEFHVSPFMGMDFDYDWCFTDPSRHLNIHMKNIRDTSTVFDATMILSRRKASRQNFIAALFRFPFMTAKVIGAIYWNALRLWIKRCPFHTHPSKLDRVNEGT